MSGGENIISPQASEGIKITEENPLAAALQSQSRANLGSNPTWLLDKGSDFGLYVKGGGKNAGSMQQLNKNILYP